MPRSAKQMTRITVIASGYECDCSEHLKRIANVSRERITEVVIEIAEEQRESYVNQ